MHTQVRKLGPNANPAVLKTLPLASGAMWAFYAGYLGYVMLSTAAPGVPAWQVSPEALQAVLHESYNYFYVNIGLAQVRGSCAALRSLVARSLCSSATAGGCVLAGQARLHQRVPPLAPPALQLGLNPVPCIAEHPVSEAMFNAVNAWSLMWWPVMLADPLGRRVKSKLPIWVGTQVRRAACLALQQCGGSAWVEQQARQMTQAAAVKQA